MLKVLAAILAVALVGSASAAGWRDLRIDGSSEQAFAQSLARFKEKLSTARQQVFGLALQDIWAQGVKEAEAEQRQYTAADYHRQVDGLGYGQVVTFTDPTGETARERKRAALRSARTQNVAAVSLRAMQPRRPRTWTTPSGPPIEGVRGTPNTQGRGW
jgi:hypothetical protein